MFLVSCTFFIKCLYFFILYVWILSEQTLYTNDGLYVNELFHISIIELYASGSAKKEISDSTKNGIAPLLFPDSHS